MLSCIDLPGIKADCDLEMRLSRHVVSLFAKYADSIFESQGNKAMGLQLPRFRGSFEVPSKFEVFSKTHVFSNESSLLLALTPVKIFDYSNSAGKAQKRITPLALKVNCISTNGACVPQGCASFACRKDVSFS